MRFRHSQPAQESENKSPEPSPPDTEQINAKLFRSLNNEQARLTLRYMGEDRLFTPGPRVFSIGRSKDCDIVVNDRLSSRRHARFVYRKGKFVLIDHSTNGTFIKMNGQTEICLVEQEQLPLTGSGIIALGSSTSRSADNVIHFTCNYDDNQIQNH
jgi:hypothetical protein